MYIGIFNQFHYVFREGMDSVRTIFTLLIVFNDNNIGCTLLDLRTLVFLN